MERRNFVLFLVLSMLVLMLNQYLMPVPPPNKPAPKAPQQAAEKADAEKPVADKPVNDNADEGPDKAAVAEIEAEDSDAEAAVPTEFVTLGSVDAASGYRMLATLTNEGAAVRRIELSSPRYLDLHDRGGYLGHLELAKDENRGLLVRAVGAGTPAANAGLRAGDRLLEGGRGKTRALAAPEDLGKELNAARPRQELSLVIERDGQRQTLTSTLARRPLEVIRPEAENVLLRMKQLPKEFKAPDSLLLTLDQVDEQKPAAEADELPGVDLHSANWRVVPPADGQGADTVTFERRIPKYDLVVTKRYRLSKATEAPKPEKKVDGKESNADMPAYDLTLEVSVRNASEANSHNVAYRLDGPNGLPVEGWWYANKVGRDWGAVGLRDVIGRYVGSEPHQRGAALIAKGDVEDFEGDVMAYMGVDAQYFCVALVPKLTNPDAGWIPRVSPLVAGWKPDPRVDGKYANVSYRLFSKPLPLKPGESVTHTYTLFAGPKQPELLAKYRPADIPASSLSDFVYYGWFGAVARGMVGLLHVFYNFVGNYGVAIIMLTVLVRGCMFPVSRGQARSMAKLQELKPEMERIKEKFKGDQTKQAQAMQQLYRKHNVNPLGGCLPALIQLPVFVGLYRGLAVDVELRGSPLFGQSVRWCSNLAAPDMLYDWSGFMPSFVTRGEGILGLGPYLNVLPLVTIALFLVQQKLFTPPAADEQAAMQQKVMKFMMIFMGILFYKVPSGLCLYFIASSLWGIAERKLIPPATTSLATAGGAGDNPPTRANKSVDPARERRAGRNGNSAGGKSGAKAKRRR